MTFVFFFSHMREVMYIYISTVITTWVVIESLGVKKLYISFTYSWNNSYKSPNCHYIRHLQRVMSSRSSMNLLSKRYQNHRMQRSRKIVLRRIGLCFVKMRSCTYFNSISVAMIKYLHKVILKKKWYSLVPSYSPHSREIKDAET